MSPIDDRIGLRFDSVAERYHDVRPRYPDSIWDALFAITGLRPGARVLEIGAGTGIATAALVRRGCHVTALEPGAAMAAIIERDLGETGQVDVHIGRFEDFAWDGEPFDLAIGGDGFFQVRRGDGQIALTRSGAFMMNANRELVTPGGERLVPPITIPANVDPSRVSIAADGTVTAEGRRIGQIQLVTVPAPNGLAPAGDNLFLPTAASGGVRAATGQLVQGALEASNVDLADAMVDMMDAQRSYSMASKAIHMQDQMMEIANQIKQ